jgi:hypothetical protein
MENWIQIKYAPNYEVSDLGNIRKIGNNKILKGSHTGKRGSIKKRYSVHGLQHNGKRIFNLTHRIVASHFVPNENLFDQVNHIDGDTFNNKKSNLEWVDNKANARHSNKRDILQFDINGNLVKEWGALYEIGDAGFNKPHISMALNGIKKSNISQGYKWEYKKPLFPEN